jgi:hypothetical protein
VSFALTAPLAGLVGARTTLVGASVIGTVATVAALLIPGIRNIEGQTPRQDADTPNRAGAAASQA